MKRLMLTDALRCRLAIVEQAEALAVIGVPVAVAQCKVELADEVIATLCEQRSQLAERFAEAALAPRAPAVVLEMELRPKRGRSRR